MVEKAATRDVLANITAGGCPSSWPSDFRHETFRRALSHNRDYTKSDPPSTFTVAPVT